MRVVWNGDGPRFNAGYFNDKPTPDFLNGVPADVDDEFGQSLIGRDGFSQTDAAEPPAENPAG